MKRGSRGSSRREKKKGEGEKKKYSLEWSIDPASVCLRLFFVSPGSNSIRRKNAANLAPTDSNVEWLTHYGLPSGRAMQIAISMSTILLLSFLRFKTNRRASLSFEADQSLPLPQRYRNNNENSRCYWGVSHSQCLFLIWNWTVIPIFTYSNTGAICRLVLWARKRAESCVTSFESWKRKKNQRG